MQPTEQPQPRDMEWQLSWSHWRAVIIGTNRGVNDDSLGTCGGPKKYERIIGAGRKVLVGSEIPGVLSG